MQNLGNSILIVLIVATVLTVAAFMFPNDTKDSDTIIANTFEILEDEKTGDELREEAHPEIVTPSEILPPPIVEEPEVEPEPIVEEPVQAETEFVLTDRNCRELLDNSPFYQDPHMTVVRLQQEMRTDGFNDTADLLLRIACYPQATWLTWRDAEAMKARVIDVTTGAEEAGQIPVLVIYNSPDFNTTKWWVGNEGEDYLNWVRSVGEGVGNREAWIIVEPDALGLSTDYSQADKDYRHNELKQAVMILKEEAPNARVYLDAGHNKWKTPRDFAELLIRAGVREADGFAQNISNYQSLEDEIERGEEVSRLLGGKHFIIDTSRNGVGAPTDNEWCNARGRGLGVHPTLETNNTVIDAFLWIKPPGESDGTCNNGPTPGRFWLEYALELIANARN